MSVRRAVVGARIAGVDSRFGRAELSSMVARVVAGHADATFGLELGPVSREEVWSALADAWGWDPTAPTATIAVEQMLQASAHAADRVAAVAAAGGTVAFATGRPASMLWCYQQLAAHLEAEGARVLRSDAVGPVPRSGTGGSGGRSVWWHGAVAVVTDGHSLLADDGLDLGEEWLFTVGRPDLVVADRGFAAAAAAAGHETIACADLDAVALEVAARQGLAIVVVPVDDCCAPAAYSSLVERLTQPVAVPAARPVPGGPGGGGESHSTTPAPGAYAAP